MIFHKNKLFFFFVFLFLLILGLFVFKIRTSAKNIISINGHELAAELANTPAEQYRGLSNRESLCADCGMLFIFPDQAPRTFVMREMNFSLDFVWIINNEVVKIDENAMPEGKVYKNNYLSGQPVDKVLEVNAGWAAKNNIKVNDHVQFNSSVK
ncbi:MAG: DUF192 domain-containing protein [Patescibacteria group bacterium]|jgi:hypothetical protein